MDMIKVKQVDLNDTEKRLVVACINHCGSGDHPVASSDNVGYFALDYAYECVGKAVGESKGEFKDNFNALADKIDRELREIKAKGALA